MKHVFTLITGCLLMANTSFSQEQLPNNGFEEWEMKTYEDVTYEGPSDWEASACVSTNIDASCTVYAKKSENARSGTYAAELTPGVVGLINHDYTDVPAQISFYAKSNFHYDEDTLTVTVGLHDGEFFEGNAGAVYVDLIVGESTDGYTQYTANFPDLDEASYEHISVHMSFMTQSEAEQESTVLIDDIELVYDDVASVFDLNPSKKHVSYTSPNPVKHQLNIDEAITSYQIMNSTGQVVFAGQNTTADLSGLQPGMYTISLKHADGNVTTDKFIKE